MRALFNRQFQSRQRKKLLQKKIFDEENSFNYKIIKNVKKNFKIWKKKHMKFVSKFDEKMMSLHSKKH